MMAQVCWRLDASVLDNRAPDESEIANAAFTYLRAASGIDYASVAHGQECPWPSLAFGAAGVAYSLWHTGGPDRAKRLDGADKLLREAHEAQPGDYWPSSFGSVGDLQQSLYYGPAGVGFVRILVARARDDAATYTRELAGYLAYCRSRTLAHADELLLGAAGLLNGARILHRHTREPRLATAASALAARLLDRISCPADGWLSLTSWGFGHGTAGIFHSLLSWSRAFDGALPVEFSAGLARFAEAARRDELNVRAGLARSWCNGSAGNVLLWTAAFECTQNEGYLELAERDALALLRQSPNVGADLCCGSAGRAYALLAMDRVQPNRGWHERALELGERAARAIRAAPGKWPHGLYKGYPGLVCLSYDLAHASNERAGFPLVEG